MSYLETAKQVLKIEADALLAARERLTDEKINQLIKIFEYLKTTGGSLVFCGVGKSGHIAQKISSTFCSLGLSSWFLHPTEALHGDLGRIGKNDAIVLISKSGTTEEIIKLLPFLPIEPGFRIGLLGAAASPIAQKCGLVLDCYVEKEACINNMAPTTSSTLALAMGDALAVIYESMVDLSQEGFAVNHPGGILGKSLRYKVSDLMWEYDRCPILERKATLQDAILIMTKIPVGGCAVIDENRKLLGIIVEGDIRRTFTRPNSGLETLVEQVMNSNPITIGDQDLAFSALKIMEQKNKQITVLPVIDQQKTFLGFIRLHDLLQEGFLISKS